MNSLIGLPFTDSDAVLRTAVDEASVPALLMSMVHMTGDPSLFDDLPRPYLLIPMDLQGAMSEAAKKAVRDRAFDVVRDYRDRGCPAPFPTLYGFRIVDYRKWTRRVNPDGYDLRP